MKTCTTCLLNMSICHSIMGRQTDRQRIDPYVSSYLSRKYKNKDKKMNIKETLTAKPGNDSMCPFNSFGVMITKF